ncbi:MAG: glutamate synthase subunit beta [Cyclobacteriaceae bacterium]|nr:glutamate synthase subunit beta [Cyclobacteriaceae bacterium]
MGKVTGFLEYQREIPHDRSPEERVKDWKEFHLKMPEGKLQEQGARCMSCGVPFCHTGTLISGMASGCPINNLIPDWNDMVYKGQWKKALQLLMKTNNFPEFTGRVCPAPCEGSCVLGINEPPVTIKNIENSIIEKGFAEGWIQPTPPQTRTGKQVAVVGSGPAGLACADQLNKAGHLVTVFERDDRVGGLLMYGIPNMKLDKEKVVNRRISLLEQEGIIFKTNVEVGVNYPAQDLMNNFDAVVLCTGATNPRDLPVPGRELKGVHFAMDFLRGNTKSLLDSQLNDGQYLDARDKHVVVIGGGDTGTDCVATSLRHECRSLQQLEILERPPLERAPDNPWPEWPKVYYLDYGQEEAKAAFGDDPRYYCSMTKKFVGDESGQVKEIHLVTVKWEQDEHGRYRPLEIPGSQKVLKADLVLLAMGYLGPESQLLEALGVISDARSNIQAPYGTFTTNINKVFAAGDARRGQSLVVWAINEGRAAARECDKFLMGQTFLV